MSDELEPCHYCGQIPNVEKYPSCEEWYISHCGFEICRSTEEKAIRDWNNAWCHRRIAELVAKYEDAHKCLTCNRLCWPIYCCECAPFGGEKRIAELEAAIRRALDDSESGEGWGPDVTVCQYLRDALTSEEK